MTNRYPQRSVFQLVHGADWACAHGDAGGLLDVIGDIVARLPPPLRQRLSELGGPGTWEGDPFARWTALRAPLLAGLRAR